MEFLNDYLVLIVVGLCLCVGYVIKHYIPTDNKHIPLVLAILGVILNVWVKGFIFTPEILLGGMFSGLASTGLHQAFKAFINKNNEKEGE